MFRRLKEVSRESLIVYNYDEIWLYCCVPLQMLIVEMVMMIVD